MPGRDGLVLACFCLLCFVSQSWSAPLFDLDEGAFAQATMEMLSSGNWLTTTLDGAPRYDKPMLSYWLQGLSVRVLGVTELAFRLPSLIAAFIWVGATYRFGRETFAELNQARTRALFAAASLAGALMIGIIAHAATADALLNLWLALSFFELWRWLDRGSRPALLRLYLWVALGMLTKGPIAAAIPLLSGLLFAAAHGRLRQAAAALLEWRGWLICLSVLGLWLVPLAWQGQLGFVWEFLWQHNLQRLSEPAQGHAGQVWFYLLWLPLVLLPFSSLLPHCLGLARHWRHDRLASLALIWLGLALLIFTLSSTKLPHYILYGCTPLFVLFGREITTQQHRRILIPGIMLLALLAALPLWLPRIEAPEHRAFEHGILALAREQLGPRHWLLGGLAVAGCIYVWCSRLAISHRLLVMAAVQALVLWYGVLPLVVEAQQRPVKQAAELARAAPQPVVAYRTKLPSFSVYRGAPTQHRKPEPGELVFVRRDRIARLRRELADADLQPRFERGGIALLFNAPQQRRNQATEPAGAMRDDIP